LWRPNQRFWKRLLKEAAFPPGLAMNCDVWPDRTRHFFPGNGAIGTIVEGTILGDLILDASGRTKPENDVYSASAIQLWNIAPNLRELFSRRFKRLSDLEISHTARCGHNDVLPDRLGIPPESNARRWTTAELLRIGKEAAKRESQRLNTETCIQYGLYEAAKLDPLGPHELTESNVRRILRHCLFDLGPSQVAVDRKIRRLVRDRFIKAVQRHGRCSNAAFQRWIDKDFNNIVHQIAKKMRPGGPIDRAVVRQAIVEESFDAHFEVARAMDQGMKAFAASLPKPLTRKEKVIFATLYFGQPWLGGLTLMMLHSHFPALKPAILDVQNDPRSLEAHGTVIRLLQFYGEMAYKRREADREIKKRRFARNVDGRPARDVDRKINTLALRPTRDVRTDTLVDDLVQMHSISCKCRRQGQWSMTAVDRAQAGQRVTLRCEQCGQVKIIKLTAGAIQKLRRELSE
jgi:hypothetical protein